MNVLTKNTLPYASFWRLWHTHWLQSMRRTFWSATSAVRRCFDTEELDWKEKVMSFLKTESKNHLVVRRQNYSNFPTPPPPPGLSVQPCTSRWSAPTVHLNFRGRGRAPSPSPFSKINLRRFFQSTPDLGNEPIELAQILHAAPI